MVTTAKSNDLAIILPLSWFRLFRTPLLYKEFSKSISNTRSRPSRRKRRSDNINNNVNSSPIRPRRSKRRKGGVNI
ncbi:hypothetical protein P9112_000156 [Eukaryota sp. TZLM1-RC]